MGGAAASVAPTMRVDHRCAPRARASVVSVDLEGQELLLDQRTGALHELNGTAALIWSRCDGSTTLDALVGELAEAFGVPRRDVRAGVYDVVGRLADADLLEQGPGDDAEFVPRLAPRRRPPCAPCLAKLNSLGWAGTVAVRVGEDTVGVRATTEEGLAAVAALLAPSVVDDPTAPVHYSVVTAGRSERGPRELHRLYLGDQLLVRTRSLRRVLRAVAAHLDGHLDPTRDGHLLVAGPVLVRGDRAVLVSEEPGGGPELTDGHLRQLGISRWDGPSAAVVGPAQLLLPGPSPAFDGRVLDDLDDPDEGAELPQPAPGVRILSGWLIGPAAEQATAARAIAAMLPSVRNLHAFGAAASLEALAAQVTEVALDPSAYGMPAAYAEAVDRLLR